MITLTPPTAAHQQKTFLIDGVTLIMTWHYLIRDESWRIDVADDNEDAIILGQRLCAGWNPFLRVKDERMPPGEFYVSAPAEPIGEDGFSEGATLVYFSREEADEIGLSASDGVTISVGASS